MKRIVLVAVCGLAVGLFSGMAFAGEEVTLTGEAVDIACYLGGASGSGHASCATKCAEGGKPIGLVVGEGEDAEMYLVLSDGMAPPKDIMAAHMGKVVTVTGEVVEQDGMKCVKVASVEEAAA